MSLPAETQDVQPGDDDKLHEECGVFGVWNSVDAAAVTALGLTGPAFILIAASDSSVTIFRNPVSSRACRV